MPRDVVIPGECLVRVKGSTATSMSQTQELGLASEGVSITPRFRHRDIKADDFGPDIPAEVMWNLADVTIDMTLVHFDDVILNCCMAESMCGRGNVTQVTMGQVGTLAAAGSLLGNNLALYASGNHYVSLNLQMARFAIGGEAFYRPWTFPTCYLTSEPLKIPVGTDRQLVQMQWRAIPYGQMVNGEVRSAGSILFTRTDL